MRTVISEAMGDAHAGEVDGAAKGGRGRFIVLDGVDGCGKTTQAARLVERLRAAGGAPLHVREPGSTPLGERLRELLLGGEHELDAGLELLLLAASRRALLAQLVGPALAAGRDVVCERFHASTFAYQAEAGGLDGERVLALLGEWAGWPRPDVEVVIDTDPDRAAERRERGRIEADRIEAKGLAFQRRVARGYRRYAERVPGAVLVDGDRDVDLVARAIEGELARVP